MLRVPSGAGGGGRAIAAAAAALACLASTGASPRPAQPVDETLHFVLVVGYVDEGLGGSRWHLDLSEDLEEEVRKRLQEDRVVVDDGRSKDEAAERCQRYRSCDVVVVRESHTSTAAGSILRLEMEIERLTEEGLVGKDAAHRLVEVQRCRLYQNEELYRNVCLDTHLGRLAVPVRRHVRTVHRPANEGVAP